MNRQAAAVCERERGGGRIPAPPREVRPVPLEEVDLAPGKLDHVVDPREILRPRRRSPVCIDEDVEEHVLTELRPVRDVDAERDHARIVVRDRDRGDVGRELVSALRNLERHGVGGGRDRRGRDPTRPG